VCRLELLRHVHRPKFHTIAYNSNQVEDEETHEFLVDPVDLPPALLYLRGLPTPPPGRPNSLGNRPRNDIFGQMKTFYRKAKHVYEELGTSASEYYISESLRLLEQSRDEDFGERSMKRELMRYLGRGNLKNCFKRSLDKLETSKKFDLLLSFLAKLDPETRIGIIFVQQRATIGVLHFLLTNHPSTKDRFKCVTFVGNSGYSGSKCTVGELFDVKTQGEGLEAFRAGTKNLVIATDVLEEGIDVSACNLVICFDPPSNLKSFVQRRGRARHEESDFVGFFASNRAGPSISSWLDAEKRLIEYYMLEEDQRAKEQELEENVEEETLDYVLEVKSTG
jgi:ERCC4-related helicase